MKLIRICFLSHQLEQHSAGGCIDNYFALLDGIVKSVGKESLHNAAFLGRNPIYLGTPVHVAIEKHT